MTLDAPSVNDGRTPLELAYTVGNILNRAIEDPDSALWHCEDLQTTTLDSLERRHARWTEWVADLVRPNRISSDDLDYIKMASTAAENEVNSDTDKLTGIHNRRFMEGFITRELSQLAREANPEKGLAVIMLDLDNFKTINDKFGHEVGDRVLQMVAQCLNVRSGDAAGRWGGDEFLIAMPTDDIEALAKHLFGQEGQFHRGSLPNTWLRELNEAITEGIAKLKEELKDTHPDFDWQPVMFDGVSTYVSAGMGYMNGVVAGPQDCIPADKDRLIRSADEEEKNSKQLRKCGR